MENEFVSFVSEKVDWNIACLVGVRDTLRLLCDAAQSGERTPLQPEFINALWAAAEFLDTLADRQADMLQDAARLGEKAKV